MEIIWYWAWGSAVRYTSLQTSTNKRTIISWFSKIRNYLYAEFLEAHPLGGNDYEWQIDESYFSGRRKYNRGKYKTGDYVTQGTVADQLQAIIGGNSSKRNYGNRVEGSWIFGMVLQKKSTMNENFFFSKSLLY